MKVLYVLGRGRSGSTIFANVLGELDGFFSGGEIRSFWDPVVVKGSTCGCGDPIRECRIWSRALERVAHIDLAEISSWQRYVVKEGRSGRLMRYRRSKRWDRVERFAEVMAHVYDALVETTGARVIIDSSKRPSYGAFLRSIPGVEAYYVHLVREPRASAYSWRTRRLESSRGSGEQVKRRGPLDSTLRWNLLNIGADALLERTPPNRALRIRYEDFIARPREHVEMVRLMLGEPAGSSPFLDEHSVLLRPNHTIAGNPSRFLTGAITLQDKGEWRQGMSSRDRWIATAVAFPFLHRYGYPISGRPSKTTPRTA